MNNAQREQRVKALARSGCICPVCGGSIYQFGTPQYAHKIANTKMNREKYGSFFIDNSLNGEMVCSLNCNQALNIGFNRGAVLCLLADIIAEEMRNF